MLRPKVSIITPVKIRHPDELVWLGECVDSVIAQTEPNWEMVIVDDNSDSKFDLYEVIRRRGIEDPRIQLYHMLSTKTGTSNTRNAAAGLAISDLLLPLDADDLLDENTVRTYLEAWDGKGFLYPSVTLFGGEGGEVTVAPEPYDFDKLLRITYLLVGNLHTKASWKQVGGWRTDMGIAYEDWEYWIHLGKIGVCGRPVRAALYKYRRNPYGRIAHIKKNLLLSTEIVNHMKSIHEDLYKGARPMGCCGNRDQPRGVRNMTFAGPPGDNTNIPGAAEGLVRLKYLLSNEGMVPWIGPVTHTTYMFSHGKPVSYVDVRDATVMVNLRENRLALFEILPNTPEPVLEVKGLVEGKNVRLTMIDEDTGVSNPVVPTVVPLPDSMFSNIEMTPYEEARNHPIETAGDDDPVIGLPLAELARNKSATKRASRKKKGV